MEPADLSNLRAINQRLETLLSTVQPVLNSTIAISPQLISQLFADLLLSAEILRDITRFDLESTEVEQQVAAYRLHFSRLQSLMPAIQTNLLVERARLETQRNHLASVVAWTKASRDSL